MTPIHSLWDGEAFLPLPRFHNIVNREYTVGETYPMAPHYERTAKTHAHEFAWLKEAWLNLPEDIAPNFPTEEHLRKWALIKAGYADVQDYVAASRAEALRWGTNLSAALDDYAVVTVTNTVVRVARAKSQSYRAMDRETFQASKTAVLAIVADLIGKTPEELTTHAAQAA